MTTDSSQIATHFNGLTLFITGGTGFLGSIYIEKILRACPNVKKFLMLLRPKKGLDEKARLQDFLQKPIFSKLRKTQPNFHQKIQILSGDVTRLKFGLTHSDLEILLAETNIIINCAATVKFMEHISPAALTNIRSTMELVKLAKNMRNLSSFLHISTAFTYCHFSRVDEVFYQVPMTAEDLVDLVENTSDNLLEKDTKKLLANFPNTYVFTKALAEDFLRRQARDLPVIILRPGIVISTYKEPICGWIDNSYGPTGAFNAITLGILRCYPLNPKVYAELVPVDYVVNCGIVAISQHLAKPGCKDSNNNQIQILNYVSSPWKHISWGHFYKTCENLYRNEPSIKAIWSIDFKMIHRKWHYKIYSFLFNGIRAKCLDFALFLTGNKPIVYRIVEKIERSALSIPPILSSTIEFSNSNVANLWKSMAEGERELFNFNMENFDWDDYLAIYMRGLRTIILQDPLSTVPESRKRLQRFEMIDFSAKVLFRLFIALLFCYVFIF